MSDFFSSIGRDPRTTCHGCGCRNHRPELADSLHENRYLAGTPITPASTCLHIGGIRPLLTGALPSSLKGSSVSICPTVWLANHRSAWSNLIDGSSIWSSWLTQTSDRFVIGDHPAASILLPMAQRTLLAQSPE